MKPSWEASCWFCCFSGAGCYVWFAPERRGDLTSSHPLRWPDPRRPPKRWHCPIWLPLRKPSHWADDLRVPAPRTPASRVLTLALGEQASADPNEEQAANDDENRSWRTWFGARGLFSPFWAACRPLRRVRIGRGVHVRHLGIASLTAWAGSLGRADSLPVHPSVRLWSSAMRMLMEWDGARPCSPWTQKEWG